MSALVTRHLQAARERGAAVAVLIASEATIYGRDSGSGRAPRARTGRWTCVRPGCARRCRAAAGSDRAAGAAAPGGPWLYRAGRTAGDIDRPEPAWWDPRLGITQVPNVTDDTVVTALATDDAGTPVGYLR